VALAQPHVNSQVLASARSILDSNGNGGRDEQTRADDDASYLVTATWADNTRTPWSVLHIAEGLNNCQFPGADSWVGSDRDIVLDAIQDACSFLADAATNSFSPVADGPDNALLLEVLEDFKFLIDFLGGMHQPSHHCGCDRGGDENEVD